MQISDRENDDVKSYVFLKIRGHKPEFKTSHKVDLLRFDAFYKYIGLSLIWECAVH